MNNKETLRMSILLALMLMVFMLLGLASCESKSSMALKTINNTPYEKVVVIDVRKLQTTVGYMYKVKRIEKGVVDYIRKDQLYASGDTIFHKFINN